VVIGHGLDHYQRILVPSPADYFLVANEQSATGAERRRRGPKKSEFGFPVSPSFADFAEDRPLPSTIQPASLYMINAAKRGAADWCGCSRT